MRHVPARPGGNGLVSTCLPNAETVRSTKVTRSDSFFLLFSRGSATAASDSVRGPSFTMFSYFPDNGSSLNRCVTLPTNGPSFPELFPELSEYAKSQFVFARSIAAGFGIESSRAQSSLIMSFTFASPEESRSVPFAVPAAARRRSTTDERDAAEPLGELWSASDADPRRDGRRGKRPGRLLVAKPTEPTDATGTRSEDVWDAKGDTVTAARNERALASIADECARVEVLARGRLMR